MWSKRLTQWYYMLVVLVAVFIIYIMVTYDNEQSDAYNWKESVTILEGWQYLNESGDWVSTKLPVSKSIKMGVTYTIANTLPEMKEEGNVLCFRSDHLLIHAYVDDKEIYSLQTEKRNTISKSPGLSYVFIPINSDCYGKSIRIEYMAVYTQSSFHITQVFLGDKTTIITGLIRQNGLQILLCSCTFLLGIMFIISYFIKHHTFHENRSLLFLGMFSIFVSMWSISETQVLQFFIDNVYGIQYITYLCLALTPLAFMFYYSQSHELMDTLVSTLIRSYSMIVVFICLLLQTIGLVDLPDMIVFIHSSIAFVLFYCVSYEIRMFILCREKLKLTLETISIVALLGCTLLDLIRYYVIVNADYSKYLRFGLFIYMALSGLNLIFRSMDVDKENRWLEHLAYMDEITGLRNRAALIKYLDDIRNENKHGYTLVKLMVINLNSIVESIGYQAKDEMLSSAAKMIEKSFFDYGTAYYIGENEFAVIVEDKSEAVCHVAIQALTKRLHNSNKSRGVKLEIENECTNFSSLADVKTRLFGGNNEY